MSAPNELDRRAARNTDAEGDLRQRLAELLAQRADAIAADAIAVFPFTGVAHLDAAFCRQVADALIQLLTSAVRDGRVDARGDLVGLVLRLLQDRSVTLDRLFGFAYLVERAALDDVAVHEGLGATAEPWPLVAQFIHRAAFDVLGEIAEHARRHPTGDGMIDVLTTLHRRSVLDAVLLKELERARRTGYPISIILFDLDHLSKINAEHGHGVGDKVLERLGILVRTFFRQHDWVARHEEDAVAVLLTHTDPEHAARLAEAVRVMVEERLTFVDHRTDRSVRVTLSGSIVNLRLDTNDVVQPERLIVALEAALDRAKEQGRNRIERVDGLGPDARA